MTSQLFDSCWLPVADVAGVLAANHYLGAATRGFAWSDDAGVIVLATPTARNLPQQWLELTRWCILDRSANAGSRQWARMIRALRQLDRAKAVTTIVSYSDPSVGHTGALYRACNWRWAPTWHRLRPPPTANGSWKDGRAQSVKDRWIFPLRADAVRADALQIDDGGVLKRFPWAVYREPAGVPYRAPTEWASA